MLLELYKKLRRYRMLKRVAPYVSLAKDSYYGNGFFIDIRFPEKGHINLETGKNCIIEGSYIFEKREAGFIKIGDRCHIGGSTFISINEIRIDDDVTIAWDCLFYDHNSHSIKWEERQFDTERELSDVKAGCNIIANKNWNVVKTAPIHICSKAWIGVGAKIMKGVTVGEGAVVGAGSVVVKDVEPWTVVRGNPAAIIRKLT